MNLSSLAWLREGGFDLLVESFSSVAQTIQIRGYTENELIIHDHTTTSDRSLRSSVIGITGSPLYMTARSASGISVRGQCYVKVSLRIEGVIVATLFGGYITETSSVAFPNGNIEDSLSGKGVIRSITGTDPALGTEISETVPTNAFWRLISARFSFTTDATVISRSPLLVLDDGTTSFWKSSEGSTIPASTNRNYFYANTGAEDTTTSLVNILLMPSYMPLQAGFRITTQTNNLQAGDNFAAPQLWVEEWINP